MVRTSPLLSRDGAVEADPPDDGIAAHYGSFNVEQRRFSGGDGFVDLSNRDVVTITGPDRLGWLHSLTTQYFEGLAPDTPTQALLLSPQGRVEHAFAGFDDGETFWAHTEPERGAALIEWLDSMRFMMRVEVANVTDAWAVVGRPGLTYELIGRDELDTYADAAGDPVGVWAWEALRIAAGAPRLGLDTDDRAIPNEMGWISTPERESALHLDKGCYRGQETVARVHTLGKPPRRLTLLHLDGSAEHLPSPGTELMSGDRKVGAIGSSARHYELGPIALGLIKRNVATDATLLADGVAAAQEVVVDPEVGLHARPVLR